MTEISLKEACKELSISVATGRNWLRLGKITPFRLDNKTPYFDKKYISQLKSSIISGKNKRLKSRRNKKYVSGSSLYNSYISKDSQNLSIVNNIINSAIEYGIKFNTTLLETLVAEYAIKFLQQLNNHNSDNNSQLKLYLDKKIELGNYNRLINDLISKDSKRFIDKYPKLFLENVVLEKNEDILGLIYISCKSITERKAKGAYYTPTTVVKQLIANLNLKNGRILDSCCGTGNFLLQLPESTDINNIFGNDLDSTSIKIARINMAIRFQLKDINILYKNFTNKDFLKNFQETGFDYIIGNPPWAYEFNEKERQYLKNKYSSAKGNTIESYDVILEEGLNKLNPNGILSFVLPEAILNVKSHKPIREVILKNSSISYIAYLGDIFDKVQCPSIILELTKSKITKTKVHIKEKEFITHSRETTPDYFSFLTTDEEEPILKKILSTKNCKTLKNNAEFALGIVTGDNKNLITHKKTSKTEIILKGCDIEKYRINPPENYIEFLPEKFQQVAPTQYYRAEEKLLYRFISDKLVFAYDNNKTLSLNSCNIIIPKIDNLSIKYILAVLNSSIAQFIFQKRFHSVKVLRSHLEEIPLPIINNEKQEEIIRLVEQLETNFKEENLNKLDEVISSLYGLTETEYKIILKTL